MLNQSDFWFYDENEEKQNGVYWEFVNSTNEDLEKADLYYDSIRKIIENIKDEKLKQKMCNKLYNIILEQGIDYTGVELTEGAFSKEQIRNLIGNETSNLCKSIIEESSEENSNLKIATESSIFTIIRKISVLKDNDEIYQQLRNIMQAINRNENQNQFENLNAKLICRVIEENEELGQTLVEEYKLNLPTEFLKYIEINKDRQYMQKKSEKFLKDNISIGIDPRISFGLEIEANNDIGYKFNINKQEGYENYEETPEATVPDGTEITCPPLHDTTEDVSKICALLETMKEEGFYYNEEEENAAGQINIGLDYLDTAKSVKNFFEIFGNSEELLFHISNVEGQLTRQQVYRNSRFKPISEIIGTRIIDEDITRDELLKMLYVPFREGNEPEHIEGLQYKKNTVGIRDLKNAKEARLEIKIPNGSTEYQVWLDNIRLYGKIVEMSRKLAEIENKEEITEREENLLWLKEDLANPNNTLEDKLYTLMDLLFDDDNIKEIYTNRFYTLQQKIEETGTEKYEYAEERKWNSEKAFGIVDFQEQYESRRQRGVITFDPETGIYKENDEEERI